MQVSKTYADIQMIKFLRPISTLYVLIQEETRNQEDTSRTPSWSIRRAKIHVREKISNKIPTKPLHLIGPLVVCEFKRLQDTYEINIIMEQFNTVCLQKE